MLSQDPIILHTRRNLRQTPTEEYIFSFTPQKQQQTTMADDDDKKKQADAEKAKAEAEAEQKKKEAEEAAAQLQEMFAASKPKNVGEGLTSGVGNILGAAVGACGIVVLAPTLGLGVGVKHGGLLGGVVGLTGGAVVGVLGGAAVAVGGAVSGVTQVVRGVVATPAAIMAPRQGKWWNEKKGTWVSTSLPEDAKRILENAPDDDMDILGAATAEVEEGENVEITGTAVDTYYYDVLGVGPTAEPSAIKRKYYVLARKYHPDKVGPDDKEAADKFKEVSEAYQVLSDPVLRAKYDKEGKDGLSADKTDIAQTAPQLDPAILFAFLFGSDKFHNYVGRLATATSASIGDAPKISKEDAETLQVRRVTRLAVFLADKVDQYTDETAETERAKWVAEANELAMASYGIQMVNLIGQIYTLAAEMFLGSLDSQIGMVSLNKWAKNRHAKIKKKSAANTNKLDTLKAGLEAMKLQQKAAKDLEGAKTEEEKKKLQEELEGVMAETLLKIMWTTTVVDVTNTLHETCQMVMFDQSTSKEERKRRAEALKALGEVFEECPPPEKKDGEEEVNAKKLYEEAAFAAMLETIKRKEEAAAQSEL